MYVYPSIPTSITGIQLINPVGNAGNYNLSLYKSIGPISMHTVIVAPSGGDYTNLKTAIDAATVDTLFLISPGSYGNYADIIFARNIKYYLKRNGGSSPSDCVINFAHTGNFIHNWGNVILEGLRLVNTQSESFCFTTYTGQAIINKCDIAAKVCIGAGLEKTHTSTFICQYTNLYKNNTAHVGYLNFAGTSLKKVAWSALSGGWATYQAFGHYGDFILEDVAPVGTAGYGYEYGDDILSSEINVQLTLANGTPVNITSDGTYTLTDGLGNSVQAIVDVSLLPEGAVDESILFSSNYYWVGRSGKFNNANNWSHISGGVGGLGVPSSTEKAIIDLNSFSARGQFMSFNEE